MSVDTCPFLAFSDLSCHLEDMGIDVFWLHCAAWYSKETELWSSDQEASPSAGKNIGVVLVPCSRMEVRPYSYFRWCGYFWGPWVSFVTTDEFSVRVTKITSRIGVSWLLFWIYLFLLTPIMAFFPLGNSDHVIVSVSIDCPSYSLGEVPFHRIT